jgi:hypothetical protein
MKDKTQYYFINSETVDLLISHKQESDKYRVDELVVAQILYQFCKKMWNCECFIGFPIKNSKVNSIDQVGFSGIEYTDFIRTTENRHMQSAQELWKKSLAN